MANATLSPLCGGLVLFASDYDDLSPIDMGSASGSSPESSGDSSQDYTMTDILRSLPRQFPTMIHTGGQPYLKIKEEPVEKFRFRYKSEMLATHGSILAQSSEKNRKKIYPTVQLCGFDKPATIRCSLFTANSDKTLRTPHTHRLVMRAENNADQDDPHEVNVSQESNYTATFHGMGIIHTAKKHVVDELVKKKRLRLLETVPSRNINGNCLSTLQEAKLKEEAEEEARKMNLNSVCLCFEAFCRDQYGVIHQICEPVYSKTINNMKSTLTGDLKICRIDKLVSSCMGGEEVFILVEKVGKKNIQIRFFEVNEEDTEIWCDFGKFSELDVHHQYAIVFRTPPYKSQEIESNVDVFIQLYRPTDGSRSEPIKFQYKPSGKFTYSRKRQRSSLRDSIPISTDLNVPANVATESNANSLGNLINDLNFSGENLLADLMSNNRSDGDSDFQTFLQNLNVTDINWTQQCSSFGSLGTEILNPVKRDMERACDGFMYNGNNTFSTGVKMEEFITCDYVSTYKESMDLSTDGEKPLRGKNSSSRKEDKNMSEVTEKITIKKEPLDDDLPRKAASVLNCALKEKLTQNKLLEKVEEVFSERNEEGENPLHSAVIGDHITEFKLFLSVLEKFPYCNIINSKTLNDETCIHLAVLHDKPEFIEMLLQKGADPNAVDRKGNTALHSAIRLCHNNCLTVLLNNCVEFKLLINVKNEKGFTPLHYAALKHNLYAVEKLIQSGADVNKQVTKNGKTALHIAIQEKCKDIAEFLIKKTNININAKNYSSYTAYDLAVAEKNYDICALLQAKNNSIKAVGERGSDDVDIKEEVLSEDEIRLRIDDEEEDDDEDTEDEDDSDYEHFMQSQSTPDPTKENQIETKYMEQIACDVGVKVKEESSTSPDNGLFDDDTLLKLCDLLDESKGWINLAELLDYSFLVPSIKNSSSPSKLLFNYADLHGNVTVQDIRHFLEALDETKAVEVLDLMLAKRVAAAEHV